jgi:hypothetical protein
VLKVFNITSKVIITCLTVAECLCPRRPEIYFVWHCHIPVFGFLTRRVSLIKQACLTRSWYLCTPLGFNWVSLVHFAQLYPFMFSVPCCDFRVKRCFFLPLLPFELYGVYVLFNMLFVFIYIYLCPTRYQMMLVSFNRNCSSFRSIWVHHYFILGSCSVLFSFLCSVLWPIVVFSHFRVLSVLHRYTPFGVSLVTMTFSYFLSP